METSPTASLVCLQRSTPGSRNEGSCGRPATVSALLAGSPPGHELLEFEGADSVIGAMADDGGRRWNTLWEWAGSKVPKEPVWYLDHIGVEPGHQGGGVGTALVQHGLVRARADGVAAFLEVGNPRNVAYYERFGFAVVEAADAPDGGPHVWFMRCEP